MVKLNLAVIYYACMHYLYAFFLDLFALTNILNVIFGKKF